MIFSRDPASAYALLYMLPPFYAFYFLSRADAICHFVFVLIIYGDRDPRTPDARRQQQRQHRPPLRDHRRLAARRRDADLVLRSRVTT